MQGIVTMLNVLSAETECPDKLTETVIRAIRRLIECLLRSAQYLRKQEIVQCKEPVIYAFNEEIGSVLPTQACPMMM